MMLAGDVSVSINNGRLLVIGDSLANQVQVIGTPNGNATVAGLDGTTINGGSSVFNAGQQLRGIFVQMNDGDDHVRLHGLVLASDMVLQGNAGNDTFEVRHSHVMYFSANMGSGNDVLQLDNLYAALSSSIVMEQGDDIVSINAHSAGQHIEISTGDGNDILAANNMGMRRQLQVDMGNGDDQVLLAGETYAGRSSGFRLGNGNDFLAILPGQTLQHSRMQKFLTIDGGSGNDEVAFDSRVQVGKSSRIDGNAGTDGLARGNANFDQPVFLSFESGQVANLPNRLDSMFARLQTADIDTTIFGGPELVRVLGITASGSPLQFVENGGSVSIDENLVVQGPTDAEIATATIAITAFSVGNDSLQFTNTSGITGTFNAATGIMTLVGSGNLAAWQAALRSVRFSNNSEAPNTTPRNLNITVNTADESATASRTLNVVSTPDSPVLTVTGDILTFDIDDDSLIRPVPVDAGLTLTDLDTDSFDTSQVTVAIGTGREAGDVLGFNPETGVNGSYSSSTGVLSFTGTLDIEALQRLLRSVTFDNGSSLVGLGTRSIDFLVSDGDLVSSRSVSINVIATDSVEISTTGSVQSFTETDPATTVDPGVTIIPGIKAGSEIAISATVRIASGFVSGQDVLEFDAVAGIVGTFNSTTGVLSFTGTALVSTYESLLRSVRYSNDVTGSGLIVGDRSIEFSVISSGTQATAARTLRVSQASQERLIQNYLTDNGLTSQRTESGLHVIVEQTGNGTFPTIDDSVRVNYRGFLLDGTNFENNDDITFPLRNVIRGWQEGIPFFSEGGSGQLLIPSALAYGAAGSPPNIPPNAILRFEIDLLDVVDVTPAILDVCIDDHSDALSHFHSSLSIVVNGTPVSIDSNIGINDSVCTGLRGIHTHDGSGTLHIETPSSVIAPLGAFFQIWGETFNSNQILNNVANSINEVVMTVNGVANNQFENYILQDGDAIVIEYRPRI